MPTPRLLLPIVFAILLGAALAGCIGGDDVPAPNDDGGDSVDPQVTDTTGSIKGLVLTEALDKIANARVVLIKGQSAVDEKRTDAQGRYTMNNIEPGDYVLQFSAVCCAEKVQAVRVEAAKISTVDVQLRKFTDADLREPFVQPNEWSGFLSCGVGSPAVTTSPCGTFDEADDFLLEWELPEDVHQLVIAMDWNPTGGVVGENLFIAVENRGCTATSCSHSYARVEGAPPLQFIVNSPDGEWSFENIEGSREMQFRVFPSFDPGVFYQQAFTVYYDFAFYGPAPDGYNPMPDQ